MMITLAHSLDLQGHRGARGLAPENTLPAFARALSIGVSTLELDCAITKDGVIVVSHDALLNPDFTRGPDGRWLAHDGPSIASLSFDELQRYDVGRIRPGSPYAARFAHQQQLDGVRIPRLADLFALVRKSANSSVRFNIETKTSPLTPRPRMHLHDIRRRHLLRPAEHRREYRARRQLDRIPHEKNARPQQQHILPPRHHRGIGTKNSAQGQQRRQ
jgi:glycerophosphoryl diester phosphodiesterase